MTFVCPPEGSQCRWQTSQMEGQRLSDFYHHFSQKSFMFSNVHRKQVPAMVQSTMDGLGGRRGKPAPDSTAQPREEAISAALCVGGGSQQGRGCQDLAKCVCVHGAGALPKAHSSWWQTLCECWLRPKPGCLHECHASNNDQRSQNSLKVSFGEIHPWGFGSTLNMCTHLSVAQPDVSQKFFLATETLLPDYSYSCLMGVQVVKGYFVTERCLQLNCWVKLLHSKTTWCTDWVGIEEPWVSGSLLLISGKQHILMRFQPQKIGLSIRHPEPETVTAIN